MKKLLINIETNFSWNDSVKKVANQIWKSKLLPAVRGSHIVHTTLPPSPAVLWIELSASQNGFHNAHWEVIIQLQNDLRSFWDLRMTEAVLKSLNDLCPRSLRPREHTGKPQTSAFAGLLSAVVALPEALFVWKSWDFITKLSTLRLWVDSSSVMRGCLGNFLSFL